MAWTRVSPPDFAHGTLTEDDCFHRSYLEVELTAAGAGGRCGALLGVTWEREYPPGESLGAGGGAAMYFCGDARAVGGNEVGVGMGGGFRSGLPVGEAWMAVARGRHGCVVRTVGAGAASSSSV
jgi:hypothetical protein